MPVEPERYDELERAIDAVVESYEVGEEIDNLHSAALPNSRAVIEAYNHLRPVLYMGFYSTRSLNKANLRHGLAEHLYAAHELLVAQIERALTYDHWIGRTPKAPPPGSGEDVVLTLFREIPELRRRLNEDMLAAFEGDPAAQSVEEVVFSYPAIAAITAYRVAHVLHRANVPMIPRIISEYAHSLTGVDIHPGATIGRRFFIDHGTGVVIGETAVIHDNVKLYQGVTLGALSVRRKDGKKQRHPTLEDDVTIYSGATILGGDTVIGKGAVVGGNKWVVRSVPAGAKLFGRSRQGEDVADSDGPEG
jgi:serine O-acetyltransferase